MLKIFSFGKNQSGVLITLLVIIALGACYFFLYLPKNEEMVQERRFRCLRKIDISLHYKIETSKKQIANLANDYNKYSTEKGTDSLANLKKYIAGYSKKNFTLLLPEQASRYFNRDYDQPIFLDEDDMGNQFYIDVGSQLTFLVKTEKNNTTLKSAADKTGAGGTVIGMSYDFNQFVSSMLLSDVFDYYVIFINKTKIYEGYRSGLNISDPDSLLSIKNRISTPGIRSLRIGETDYKVFSHPAYTLSGIKWTISGLLKNDNYQAEKNQLPLWVLRLLTTAVIAMLICLPLIKLYHMGNKDRLTITDGIASILVSMVLMSLLFFAFFKYRVDLKSDEIHYSAHKTKRGKLYSKDDYSRNVLAEKITTAFMGEMNTANNLLDAFEAHHEDGDTDVHLLGKGRGKYDTLFNKYAHGLDVNQIYWMDAGGSENTNLTVDSTNDPKGNYSNRDYFNNAGAYRIGAHQFYLDQGLSYTNGTFRSVISQKAKNGSVVALSLNLKSLTNITMPSGYQFAIISGAGWVLYHSNPNRNLVEDLRLEVGNNDLLSSLKAKSDTSFKAAYYGKLYNIKIKPVPGLPYFTVIFEDVAYNDTRDIEAYTFTLSMLTGMLIFLLIKYAIVFFASSSRSFFKGQHFDISWLGPHKSSHHQYNVAAITNALVILVLVLFFNHSSFFQYLYMLLVSVVFTSLFLNFIFAEKYKKNDPYKYKLKLKAVLWLSLLLVLIDISGWFNLTPVHRFVLILFEVIIMGLFPVILWLAGLLLAKAGEFNASNLFTWTFTHSYTLMAVTRLIIISGIPVAFFFIYSFDYEQNLDTLYRQLNFANALISKESYIKGKDVLAINKKLDSLKNNLPYTSGVYSDGLFIDNMQVDTNKGIADTIKYISAYNPEDFQMAELISALSLHTNDIEIQNAYLNSPSSGNFVFSKLNKRSGDRSSVQLFYKIDSTKYLKISSLPGINYQTPHLFFWLLLVVAIIVFYYVIHAVIRKVFALDIHYNKGWDKLDGDLLGNNKFNSKVLIVGSPGSNTIQKLTYYINSKKLKSDDGRPLSIDDVNPSEINAFIADMMLIPSENWESDPAWARHKKAALAGNGLVIINHFEYNICNAAVNKIKLDLLESLVAQTTSKVIIISTVHPLIFLDSFSPAQQDQVSATERRRWYMLLGDFHVVIDPLVASDIPANIQMSVKAIKEETQYTRFLHRMQVKSVKALNKQIGSIPPNEKTQGWITDSLIFKIQVTSQYFYTDIWQSLTLEEKFLLYDLAEDGLVNSFDEFNLSLLMGKGLIVDNDGALVLFNRGFRNFILTAVGKKELNRIKEQLKDNGRWGNLKAPLNLAILAILTFLFASQLVAFQQEASKQNEYSQVITYITAFGAGIPAFSKIFSLFDRRSDQKAV